MNLIGVIAQTLDCINTYSTHHRHIQVAQSYAADVDIAMGVAGVKLKLEGSLDAVRANVNLGRDVSMDTSVGLNANTGVEAGADGVSASFLGFGISAGRNTGISTPFGSINFKLW